MLSKVNIAPGIDKETTNYGAEGRWIDAVNVRFRSGLPEKVGGWSKLTDTTICGVVRAQKTWFSTQGVRFLAIGTHRKLYIYSEGVISDITPIRLNANLTNPFTADGSSTIVVTHNSHNATEGDFVTFSGATALNGADFNAEYEVTEVVDVNSYKITHTGNVSSGTGGGSVTAKYQLNVGSATSSFGFGWGTATWNAGAWNTPRTSSSIFVEATYWAFDTFGEDLLAIRNNGELYKWDLSGGVATPAQVITQAPSASRFVLVTNEQFVLCLGTEESLGNKSTQDNLLLRWSQQRDFTTWEFTSIRENSSGFDRVQEGSKIVAAARSRGSVLIWTDSSLNVLQAIGGDEVFSLLQVGSSCGAISPFCWAEVNGVSYWMSQTAFYIFDGSVKKLECSVQNYVFEDLNTTAQVQIFCGLNVDFNEVTWFYPSAGSQTLDRSVTYNYLEKIWYTNTGFARTGWSDRGVFPNPFAAKFLPNDTPTNDAIRGVTAGATQMYRHEDGVNDDGLAMTCSLTSGDIDIEDGDQVYHISRVIPDFKDLAGQVNVRLNFLNYPTSTTPRSFNSNVTPTTKHFSVRGRGRQSNVVISSTTADSDWRYGTLRYDITPDGAR